MTTSPNIQEAADQIPAPSTVEPEAANPISPPSREQAISQDPPRKFKTLMITDSMYKHVADMKDSDSILGVNHKINTYRRTDTTSLNTHSIRDHLNKQKPDFVFIHLGINDLRNHTIHLRQIETNLDVFIKYLKDHLPDSKLFISLPIYTDDEMLNLLIHDARRMMVNLGKKENENADQVKDRRVFINANYDMFPQGEYTSENHSDGVHPSTKGQQILLKTLRRSVHEVTRILKGKPRKTGSGRVSQRNDGHPWHLISSQRPQRRN